MKLRMTTKSTAIVATALLTILPHLQAQSSCNCATTFEQVVSEVQRNYAGFATKVTATNRAQYDALVKQLTSAARAAKQPGECQGTLDRYIAFFQDGHLAVTGPWAAKTQVQNADTTFRVYDVDSQTVVVRLPDFDNAYAARIDSLFASNHDRLRRAEQLIIDLRGNRGGSDYNYWELLPLIYTNQIITKSVATYATADNIRRLQAIADDTTLPADARAGLQQRINTLRRNQGDFVSSRDDRTMFESVLPYPRRVGVLYDHRCASTCEQFLLAARQSTKVTLYGENSAGILDFANVLHVPLQTCPGMVLRYGTSRSLRLPNDPVDPAGIAPTVRIGVDSAAIELVARDLHERASHRN